MYDGLWWRFCTALVFVICVRSLCDLCRQKNGLSRNLLLEQALYNHVTSMEMEAGDRVW